MRTRAALLAVAAQLPMTSTALAQTMVEEPAITRRAGDADLKWSACPDWMPKGCGFAVLHGDPAKNNADAFIRIPGGAKLPAHWHTSAERMVLVSGELVVSYDGQKPVTLKAGSYAYGPAKKPHSAHCVSKAACMLFVAFELPIDAVPVKGK